MIFYNRNSIGETLPDEDPDNDTHTFTYNLRIPGQYYDEETGLHYNYFRDYDPSIGRYVQSDPIGIIRDYSNPQTQTEIEAGALEETGFAGEELNHLYSYVGSNPLFWVDSYGLAEHKTNKRPSNYKGIKKDNHVNNKIEVVRKGIKKENRLVNDHRVIKAHGLKIHLYVC